MTYTRLRLTNQVHRTVPESEGDNATDEIGPVEAQSDVHTSRCVMHSHKLDRYTEPQPRCCGRHGVP